MPWMERDSHACDRLHEMTDVNPGNQISGVVPEQDVRDMLLAGFEYSWRYDDRVTPLEEALAGVTAGHAAWTPPGGQKGIWDIVLHLAVWNERRSANARAGNSVT